MNIDELIPLHNSIRQPKRVKEFEHRLRMGHILRGIETPIIISKIQKEKIENKNKNLSRYSGYATKYYKYYIHDGHHRIYAAWLCGIKELLSCEYVVQNMSYEMYQDLKPGVGWVTPLDIRTHVRKPDFYGFKNKALSMYNNNEAWRQYIDNNKGIYLEPRKVFTVGDMTYAN